MPFLQFKGKTAVETYHYTVPHHTLAFDPAASVLEAGRTPSLDGNVIIEGDNLRALKALLPTHAGRVKCVYIDPPYNTGNEGWVYNDNLTQPQFKEWIGQVVGKEGEDACRHDKWCCMMYPRLMLLKELLREDGVIFVSIDDNEVAHLRLLMDEVFGEENFVATIIWQKNFAPKNSAQWFSEDHDYIVVYAKSKSLWRPILGERSEEQLLLYTNPDNDPRGPWASGDLSARNSYSKGIYGVTCPGGRYVEGPPPGTYWRIEEKKLWDLHKDNRIWWGEDQNGVPRLKRFLSEVKEGITPRTIWLHDEAGNTQEAKKGLLEVVPVEETVFQTPKPTRLIEKVLAVASSGDDIILDSFAGSGTTGQAVLQLNREDGYTRSFILVQQPYDTKDNEKLGFNICQKLTAERVRRVIEGYTYQGVQAETLLEEKVGLNTLKKADELLARIEAAREQGRAGYDDMRAEMKDGVVKVEGIKNIQGKTEGLGGAFTYARVSDAPLFGEYRDLGDPPPPYEDLAKYIFYTETSRQWDPAGLDRATGRIGRQGGTSYYLLYTPDGEANAALDLKWLRSVALADPNAKLVVYCEKFWMHRDELRRWEGDNRKSVRAMIVPFQLK